VRWAWKRRRELTEKVVEEDIDRRNDEYDACGHCE
jgi:hypothetical protein